jgi:hypothetical protein
MKEEDEFKRTLDLPDVRPTWGTVRQNIGALN